MFGDIHAILCFVVAVSALVARGVEALGVAAHDTQIGRPAVQIKDRACYFRACYVNTPSPCRPWATCCGRLPRHAAGTHCRTPDPSVAPAQCRAGSAPPAPQTTHPPVPASRTCPAGPWPPPPPAAPQKSGAHAQRAACLLLQQRALHRQPPHALPRAAPDAAASRRVRPRPSEAQHCGAMQSWSRAGASKPLRAAAGVGRCRRHACGHLLHLRLARPLAHAPCGGQSATPKTCCRRAAVSAWLAHLRSGLTRSGLPCAGHPPLAPLAEQAPPTAL